MLRRILDFHMEHPLLVLVGVLGIVADGRVVSAADPD